MLMSPAGDILPDYIRRYGRFRRRFIFRSLRTPALSPYFARMNVLFRKSYAFPVRVRGLIPLTDRLRILRRIERARSKLSGSGA